MPLTVPEVLDAKILREKARLGERTSHVDFALHGGVSPHNLAELEPMWREGATAFKIFTCDTGCPMAGLIDDADLLQAMQTIAGFGGLATFHAENNELLAANLARLRQAGRTDNLAFAEWRDETAELEAINRILFYAGRTGVASEHCPRHVAARRRAGRGGPREGGRCNRGDLSALCILYGSGYCRAWNMGHMLTAGPRPRCARRDACARLGRCGADRRARITARSTPR